MKRKIKIEDDSWDCSVCTFKNSKDAFTCEMCESRKGTSTRKPRVSTMVVEHQQQIQKAILKEKCEDAVKKKATNKTETSSLSDKKTRSHNNLPRLRNVDRSSARTFEVTSNGITITITEYNRLPPGRRRQSAAVPSPSSSYSFHTAGTGCNGSAASHAAAIHPAVSPAPSSSSSSCLQANLTSTPYSSACGDVVSSASMLRSNTGQPNGLINEDPVSPCNSSSLSSPSQPPATHNSVDLNNILRPGPVSSPLINSVVSNARHQLTNNSCNSSHSTSDASPLATPSCGPSDRSTGDTRSTLGMSEAGCGHELSGPLDQDGD